MIVDDAQQGSYPIDTGRSERTTILWGVHGHYSDTLLAERLRERIAQLSIPGYNGGVTASFGVVTVHDGRCADSMFKRADAALYAAKLGGRNRVMVDPDGEGSCS